MKIKFVNKLQDGRAKLIEGRYYGDAFAFCKRLKDGTFETVQPLSTCKDYLNDVVWSENTGSSGLFYGLNSKPHKCFGSRYAYVAISILGQNSDPSRKHTNHNNLCVGLLALCDPKREGLVAQAEKALGIGWKTRFFNAGDGVIVASVPRFWTKHMYLISLWALLVRLDITYDGKLPLVEHFEKYKYDEAYIVKGVLPKLKRIIGGDRPKQPMPSAGEANTYNVHNAGVFNFNF